MLIGIMPMESVVVLVPILVALVNEPEESESCTVKILLESKLILLIL